MAYPVVESALMATLAFVLFLASRLPPLGLLSLVLCPLPLTWIGVRYGSRQALVSTTCSATLVLLLGGGAIHCYLFLAGVGLVGFVGVRMLTSSGPAHRTITLGAIGLAGLLAPATWLGQMMAGIVDPISRTEVQVFSVLDNAVAKTGHPAAGQAVAAYKHIWATVMLCPVVVFLVASFLCLYLNHAIAYQLFNRLGQHVRPPPQLAQARMPRWATILVIALSVVLTLNGGAKGTGQSCFLLNAVMTGACGLWIAGVATVARLSWPGGDLKPSRSICLLVAGVLLAPMAMLIGMMDSLGPSSAVVRTGSVHGVGPLEKTHPDGANDGATRAEMASRES